MSNIEAAKNLYNTCKNMDIDETMQLVLSADGTDEILKEFGDWRNTADLMKAGKIAVQRLNKYLRDGIF